MKHITILAALLVTGMVAITNAQTQTKRPNAGNGLGANNSFGNQNSFRQPGSFGNPSVYQSKVYDTQNGFKKLTPSKVIETTR